MAKTLVVHFNLFSLDQDMYLLDGENVEYIRIGALDSLKDQISRVLKTESIKSICLEGNNNFIEKYVDGISQLITTKYSKDNKVEVYINGKILDQ